MRRLRGLLVSAGFGAVEMTARFPSYVVIRADLPEELVQSIGATDGVLKVEAFDGDPLDDPPPAPKPILVPGVIVVATSGVHSGIYGMVREVNLNKGIAKVRTTFCGREVDIPILCRDLVVMDSHGDR